MAVTPNLGLASPLASAVSGWIARLKADLNLIDQAFAGLAGGGANLLINPGLELDQRAGGPYSGHGAYALDRWQIVYGGAVTLAVSRETGVVDALSSQSAKCVFALGAGTIGTLEQQIERWAAYLGHTVTFRARVKCSTPNAARVFLGENVGDSSRSGYHTSGGGWETLTVTRALDAAGTALRCGLYLTADCTAYIDNASLVLGSTPLPYAPLSDSEDLRRCQRYYEVQGWLSSGGGAGHPVVHGSAGAGAEVVRNSFTWAVPKGGLPTVGVAGTWGLVNATGPTVAAANQSGYALAIAATAAGQCEAAPNSAGDVVTGEWSP
jgi:hypothetical protein